MLWSFSVRSGSSDAQTESASSGAEVNSSGTPEREGEVGMRPRHWVPRVGQSSAG